MISISPVASEYSSCKAFQVESHRYIDSTAGYFCAIQVIRH